MLKLWPKMFTSKGVYRRKTWEACLLFREVMELGGLEELEAFWACADRASVCANGEHDVAGKLDLGCRRHGCIEHEQSSGKERTLSTDAPSDRIGQDWKQWQKGENPGRRAGAKWSRTLVCLLHLKEPLCGRLLVSFVHLLVRMEDNGELPVPLPDFLVRGCLWKVEDGTVLER